MLGVKVLATKAQRLEFRSPAPTLRLGRYGGLPVVPVLGRQRQGFPVQAG